MLETIVWTAIFWRWAIEKNHLLAFKQPNIDIMIASDGVPSFLNLYVNAILVFQAISSERYDVFLLSNSEKSMASQWQRSICLQRAVSNWNFRDKVLLLYIRIMLPHNIMKEQARSSFRAQRSASDENMHTCDFRAVSRSRRARNHRRQIQVIRRSACPSATFSETAF